MAADILLTDITNGSLDGNNDWTGTGVFDVLMSAVNKNIESQYMKNRITGSDYATVYLGSIQAVLQQSMEYALREKLVAEQISLIYTERVYKDKQTAMLGMDGVMKSQNVINDASHVYVPKYNN